MTTDTAGDDTMDAKAERPRTPRQALLALVALQDRLDTLETRRQQISLEIEQVCCEMNGVHSLACRAFAGLPSEAVVIVNGQMFQRRDDEIRTLSSYMVDDAADPTPSPVSG